MKTILGLILAGGLMAADVPSINDAAKAKYWQRLAEFNNANYVFNSAKANLQAAFDAIQKSCGEKFIIGQNPDGDVVCVAKPEPKKEDTK